MIIVHVDAPLHADVLREHQNIVDQSNYNTRMQTEAEANVMHKVVTEQMREEHVQQQQALIAALAVQQQEDAAALVAEAERRHSEVISATTQQCGSQIVQVQQACQQFEHEVVTQATEYAEDREALAGRELGEYRKAYESLHYQTEDQNSTVSQFQRDFAALQLQFLLKRLRVMKQISKRSWLFVKRNTSNLMLPMRLKFPRHLRRAAVKDWRGF